MKLECKTGAATALGESNLYVIESFWLNEADIVVVSARSNLDRQFSTFCVRVAGKRTLEQEIFLLIERIL